MLKLRCPPRDARLIGRGLWDAPVGYPAAGAGLRRVVREAPGRCGAVVRHGSRRRVTTSPRVLA